MEGKNAGAVYAWLKLIFMLLEVYSIVIQSATPYIVIWPPQEQLLWPLSRNPLMKEIIGAYYIRKIMIWRYNIGPTKSGSGIRSAFG